MQFKSFLLSLLLLGTTSNFTNCAEKKVEPFAHCYCCDEEVEPWLTEENKEHKSHFNCNHTNHMHERCIQLWMLQKLEKNCPECRKEGHLKVEGNIPEKDRVPGAQLKHEMEGSSEKTTALTPECFFLFTWSCFSRDPVNKGARLEFAEMNFKDLVIALRLATVAQKNNILVKELYVTQKTKTNRNPFIAFLKYLSDNPGKHGNLILYLQQCKKDFELVSKFMPSIIDHWDENDAILPPTIKFGQLDESVKDNWDVLNQYVRLQNKFTPFNTLTILNHPTMKTVTLGDIKPEDQIKNMERHITEAKFKCLLANTWREKNTRQSEQEAEQRIINSCAIS